MAYDMSFTNNGNNILDFLVGANNMVGGWLIGVVLLILTFILYISYNHEDIKDAWIAVSWIMLIITTTVWGLGLVTFSIVLWPLTLLMFAVMYKIFGGR